MSDPFTPMSPEEFARQMHDIRAAGGDCEADHSRADDLLIACLRSLGYGEGCDTFEQIEKWYA